ncbi:gp16 family protein [Photobacterium damselae]|uniref:gp16 family protein n=1 Tax=Photobacterium damselae TaxID=38293 RepID=UPI0035A8A76D
MNKHLQLVQIAKRDLNMDDDIYRDLLQRVTGKRSAKGLSNLKLSKVLDEMKRLGFKPKPRKRLSPPSSERVQVEEIKVIRAIWITMYKQGFVQDGSENALDSYVRRMTSKLNKGQGIARVTWLNYRYAPMVLESLKQWHRRVMIEDLIKRKLWAPDLEVLAKQTAYHKIVEEYEYLLANLVKPQKPIQ